MVLSAALAVACLFSLALPLLLEGARVAASVLSGWAWEFLSRVAWDLLAALLPVPLSPYSAPPSGDLLANATLPETVPAFLRGAGPSTEMVQAVGSAWTWSCLALAAWRKARAGR